MTTVAEAFVTLRPDLSKFKRETESGLLSIGGLAKAAAIGVAAVGSAISGIAVISIKAALEEQAGMERLAQAVRTNGGDWDKLGSTIEGQITKWERLTAFSDGEMRDALSTLVALTGDATTAMDRLPIAMDFARGAQIDLSTASRLLGKVTDETTSVLARYGIRVEKGADATDVLLKVQQKFGGQSAAFAKTAAGQWKIFTDQVQNLAEDIGFALLPTFTNFARLAVQGVDAIRKKFDELRPQIEHIVQTTTAVLKTMWNSAPVQFFVNTILSELAKIPGFILQVAGSIGEMFEVLSGRGRPEAGGVLRTLVGDKAAEGIQSTLRDIRVTFTEAFDFMKPLIQAVIDKVIELKGEFDKLPDGLKKIVGAVVVTDVATTGLTAVALLAVAPFVSLFSNLLKIVDSSLMVKVATGLWGMAAGLSGNIALLPTTIGLWWLAVAPLLPLIALITAIGVALVLLATHWDEVTESARLIAQIMGILVQRALRAVGDGFAALGKAVSDFFAPFGKLLDLFQRNAPQALGLLLGAVVNTFGAVQAFIGGAIAGAEAAFGNFLEVLGGWKTDLGNLIGSAVSNALDGLKKFALDALPGLVQFGVDAFNALGTLPAKFATAAANAVGGFIVGFIQAIPNAIATIVQAAKDFIGGWNKAMGNHSPSTVFAESGRNITRGLIKGIQEGTPGVHSAIAGMTAGLTGPTALPGGADAAGGGSTTTLTVGPINLNYAGPADQNAAERLASDTLDIITESLRQQMRRLTAT